MIPILIASYNDAKFVGGCIDSIRKNTVIKYEIILLNNGSDKENSKILEGIKDVNYFHNFENEGIPKGYNGMIRYISKSNPRYICFLNADTRVETKGWLNNLLTVFNERSDAGMVCAMTNTISNKWQKLHGELPNVITEAPWAGLGIGGLIPTKVFNKVGLFDENIGMGTGIDVEFSLRLMRAKYKVYIDGKTFVWHDDKKTSFSSSPHNFRELQKKNVTYMKNKYPELWKEVM